MPRATPNRSPPRKEGIRKRRKSVEIVTSNPFFNFLRCLRARYPNWSSEKLAVEGVTLWCSLSQFQKVGFAGEGSGVKKCYKVSRKSRSSSRGRWCQCCKKYDDTDSGDSSS